MTERELALIPREHVSLRSYCVRAITSYARRVLDEMPSRSASAWTAAIAACALGWHGTEMLAEGGATPNNFVLATALSYCTRGCPAKALDRLYHMARAGVAFNH